MTNSILNLGLALALGLLIGTERGWQERTAPEGRRVAGIRTFGLIGLLGGLWQTLAVEAWSSLFGFAFLGFVMVMVAAYITEVRATQSYGITTVVAALVTFVLGALAARGAYGIAATGAVVTTALLSAKPILHRWVAQIEAIELTAALKLLLITVVILPVLPNQGYGPWQALNPYELWWLVVLMATLSFAAYVAMKLAGTDKGILLVGFLGGLVSSTAVTIQVARLARRSGWPETMSAGILIAAATMFLRILIVVAIIFPDLALKVAPSLVTMVLVAAATAVWYTRKKPTYVGSSQLTLENPVELNQAVRFAALLAAVTLITQGAHEIFGETGLYASALLSGVADVDAITISLARLAVDDNEYVMIAARAIMLAATVNTAAKAVLTGLLGGFTLGRQVTWAKAAVLLCGGFVFWLAA